MALTAPRATAQIQNPEKRNLPVAANVAVWQGGLAMLVGGYVKPGAVATGGLGVGRFSASVSNIGGAAGAVSVDVRTGVFKFFNSSGGDAITNANIGATVYIVDDETVALTNGSGTRSPAGTVFLVDPDDNGVFVDFA